MVGVGSGVGIFHGGDNKKRPAGGQPADLRDWVVYAPFLGGTRTPNIAILAFFAKSQRHLQYLAWVAAKGLTKL